MKFSTRLRHRTGDLVWDKILDRIYGCDERAMIQAKTHGVVWNVTGPVLFPMFYRLEKAVARR